MLHLLFIKKKDVTFVQITIPNQSYPMEDFTLILMGLDGKIL